MQHRFLEFQKKRTAPRGIPRFSEISLFVIFGWMVQCSKIPQFPVFWKLFLEISVISGWMESAPNFLSNWKGRLSFRKQCSSVFPGCEGFEIWIRSGYVWKMAYPSRGFRGIFSRPILVLGKFRRDRNEDEATFGPEGLHFTSYANMVGIGISSTSCRYYVMPVTCAVHRRN